MKAAPEDQVKLLDLQVLDKKIAGLKHELATLPAGEREKELTVAREELQTEIAVAKSSKNDLSRALKQAEAEVSKVQERAKTQRERLDGGGISPKEMEKIQEELGQLATRQGDLEDAALDAMDAVERATGHLNELENRQETLEEELKDVHAEAQSESGKIQEDLDSAKASRKALAEEIPADLVDEYEACRRSSGIGVVEVNGARSVGVQLEFSVAEISRIETAPPDEVLVSEDHNVIIVRR
ncbi:MAG: hypothetical protein MSC45_08540 [Mobiluncus sp.]|uniref:CT398-like coiled coil hairpin domain-containing protein n=1 Tax=Mobiluncus porci TaxID=2652278 RepID=A0A7K0K3S6_9ACTO|nr:MULTISPECIES: hypothetical protein [Mobiluncus]MCI6585096.1 hypothetical protein [Mobiluncus sp.]MST50089.1 hypothetical protein [Mobiluncus porci]